MFKKLNGNYIDIVDFHRFGKFDWYNPKKDLDYLKAGLQSSGFDVNKLRFWITETGTYSGDPVAIGLMPDLPYQTEKQQAIGLLKMYASSISYGIEEVFWAWNIVEGFQKDGSIFDYTGLVYDGCEYINGKYTCGDNVGYDKGKDVKKLSYYTYKKMVEVLDGSDWSNIQIIQEKDGVYIYKFIKAGKPIWVAWNDNSASKQVTISGITASSVKVTEAIPKYESGKEVTDYNKAFNTETKMVSGGKITLTLKDKPVFVETSQVVTAKTTPTTSGSPFGIGLRGAQEISYAKDLGFKSVRIAGISGAIWDLIKKNGFSQLDSIVNGISKANSEIFLVVLGGNPARSNDLNGYGAFIASIVERYDGDGKDDASGSPKIAYLEIDNEPDLLEDPNEKTDWKGELSEAGDYAQVLKTAYTSAKSASPNIKVAIASMAYNLEYYEAIFKELEKLKVNKNDKFFDVFNYHYYGGFDQYGAIKMVKDAGDKGPGQAQPAWSDIENLLKKYGYGDIEVAVTETGNVGSPNSVNTEKLQAATLIKKYIYPIAHGVDKVLWLTLTGDSGGGPFSSLALMSSGQEKRLNYYTYKKMVEVLDGSDWDRTQIVQEKDGVYIYKFIKNGKLIWVAWNDNSTSKTVTISGITINSVKVTEATPKYASGKEVTNYSTAFNTETKAVSGGKVTLTLKDKPVFVETSPTASTVTGGWTFPTGGKIPTDDNKEAGDSIIYSDLKYSNVVSNAVKLDLYLPNKSCLGKFPVIVMIHGGGFMSGDKANPPARAAIWVKNCYAFASINYRLSGEAPFPAANYDIKSAVRWLRANATKYNLDPDNFGAMGGSAGGALASFLGTTGNIKTFDVGDNLEYSSTVKAVIDEYGIGVDFSALSEDSKDTSSENSYIGCDLAKSECKNGKALKASPVHYVSKNSSPFLIICGALDEVASGVKSLDPSRPSTIGQCARMETALKAAGVPVTLITVPNAGHGGPEFFPYEKSDFLDFFDKYLKK